MNPETPLQEQTSIINTETTTDKETPNVSHQLDSLDLATLQLHQLQQLSSAQASAIAEAAASAAATLTGKTAAESYQQIFAHFDQNAAFAAAAAAALAACGNQVTGPQQQTKAPNLVNIAPLPSAELLKRELMNQKVRADNRERKKRWRLQNEERNKDNDLRCRVNKRAHKLFGKEDSDHKKRWVQDEFEKRQQKRKEKERKRGLVDDSLSGHNNDAGLAAIAQQLMAPQTDSNNYLTLLCNNLGMAARPEVSKQEMTQFPLQLLELLQQLQQYQQEPPPPPPVELPEDDGKAEEKLAALIASTFQAVLAANGDDKSEIQSNHNENSPEFPMDAVMTLMQLNAGTINTNNNKDTL